ncbi:MAG: Male sterility domain protein, partial [Rhodopirellula bahusiensis]
ETQSQALLGLNILGPGGGQWRVVSRQGSARLEVAHGLPCPKTITIRTSSRALSKLMTNQDLCPTELGHYLDGNWAATKIPREAIDTCRQLFSKVSCA